MKPGAFLWLVTHSSTSFIGTVLKTIGMRNDKGVIETPHEIILSKHWLYN